MELSVNTKKKMSLQKAIVRNKKKCSCYYDDFKDFVVCGYYWWRMLCDFELFNA